MKLYSRGQLIRSVIFGVVFTATATCFFFYKFQQKNQTNKNIENSKKLIKTKKSLENEQESILEQTAFLDQNSSSVIPVANNTYTSDEVQNINVYNICNEAVVNINTQVMAYNWFLEPYVQEGGSGSGAIIDKKGYILTNVHVIQGASKIYVSLYDGTQYEAQIVGQDLDSDLAVIKFTPPDSILLKTISFGDSTQLRVGQKVIAIGNPFGLERTMTTGIVSGLGRPIQNSNNRIIRNMIQTDAAINPGNSGGPLLDSTGKMVGINTMIKSNSGNSAGVGFAVPSETAIRVVADLIKFGQVQRGIIDASVIQLNRRIAQYANLDVYQGILISEVQKNGQAEKSGLLGGTEAVYYGNRRDIIYIGGDVITKIDDINISSLADYYSALESKKPGDKITVIVRRNKKNVTLKITLVGK